MYDHCAAGGTDVKPPVNPSGSISDDVLNSDIVAPLVNDIKVNRQFMTKVDFYFEIKSHYAAKSEKMVGDAGVANLRSAETSKLEKKLSDCIEEASERFGYTEGKTTNEEAQDHLEDAIAWVQETCMAS
ncbi:unnamed protein product [Phytophthora fragariaefolia]|uniref:Unnamed protein product n=1 Tax=Phytophthora fragariaefolia TaxID=1490495 RepID=A0A9W7D5F1_9STRA|nr:unnamed protein product [Phytophthora fragariaefolia]